MGLRIELDLENGTNVSIPGIPLVRQKDRVYIEEMKAYRNTLEFDKEVDDDWDANWRINLSNQIITAIRIYQTNLDTETGVATEELISTSAKEETYVMYDFESVLNAVNKDCLKIGTFKICRINPLNLMYNRDIVE